MALSNVPRAKEFFRGMGVKIVTGIRHLGGFFRNGAAEEIWTEEKVKGWAESVKTLTGVAHNHPQSTYAGLKKSLQQEWAFVQQVNPSIRNAFGPAEEALRETFLPALFQGLEEGEPEIGVTRLSVKQTGLTLPDPTKTSPEN